jgi:DUF1680 family protein
MVEPLVQGIVECQGSLGTGYVGGIPGGVRLWPRGRWSGARSSSVVPGLPRYNLHKLFAGLLDAHRHTGSDLALTAVRRLTDWWGQVAAGLDDDTRIAKVVGNQRLGEVVDDPGLRAAARFFWQTMTRHRTFSFGGNSVREHLHPRDDFSSALQSPQGPETCNTKTCSS